MDRPLVAVVRRAARTRLADGRGKVGGGRPRRNRRRLLRRTDHASGDGVDAERVLGKAVAVGVVQAFARIATPCACSVPIVGLPK